MNYNELVRELRMLRPRTKLFNILKRELSLQGRWKNKKRGKSIEIIANEYKHKDVI